MITINTNHNKIPLPWSRDSSPSPLKDPEFHLHVGGLLNPIPGIVKTNTTSFVLAFVCRLSEERAFTSNPHLLFCIHPVSPSVGQTASLSFREPMAWSDPVRWRRSTKWNPTKLWTASGLYELQRIIRCGSIYLFIYLSVYPPSIYRAS